MNVYRKVVFPPRDFVSRRWSMSFLINFFRFKKRGEIPKGYVRAALIQSATAGRGEYNRNSVETLIDKELVSQLPFAYKDSIQSAKCFNCEMIIGFGRGALERIFLEERDGQSLRSCIRQRCLCQNPQLYRLFNFLKPIQIWKDSGHSKMLDLIWEVPYFKGVFNYPLVISWIWRGIYDRAKRDIEEEVYGER